MATSYQRRVTFHWEVKFRDRNLLIDESRLYSVLLPVVHNGITLQVHNPARRGEKKGVKSQRFRRELCRAVAKLIGLENQSENATRVT